jgi:zinc D-Ala-D-Ala carboxypeptidase
MQFPNWVQGHPLLKYYWSHPWSKGARTSRKFKRMCWRHGYLSPHFKRSEWACNDGTPIPLSLKGNAQRHAFHVERFRHAVGDIPLPTLSEYRTVSYNRAIGGASGSRHTYADATDFSSSVVNAIGHDRFFAVAEVVFANGGVGEYPYGSAHLDSRGYRSRWTSF